MHRRLLCALSLAAVAIAFAISPAAAQDSVSLTFQWPEQVQGRAQYVASRTKSALNRMTTLTVIGSHDFKAAPVSDGQLITFSNPKFQVVSDTPADGIEARLRDLLLRAASTPPSYVISDTGAFVRLEGMAEFRANLLNGIDDLLVDVSAEAQARVRRVLDTTITAPQLAENIVQNWNRDVGFWVGAELAHGETYEIEYSSVTPMFGDTQIPMKAKYRVVGPASCIEGRSGSDCIELELHSFVNSEKLADALQAFLQGMAAGSGSAFDVEEFQVETVIRLVTETDTLVPHRVSERKDSVIVVGVGDERQETRELEEKRTVYSY